MGVAAPIMLFDSVCVLCDTSVHFVLKHEKHPLIRFVAIQSEEGRKLADRFGINPDDPESQLSTRSVTMGFGAFDLLGMKLLAGRGFSEEFKRKAVRLGYESGAH